MKLLKVLLLFTAFSSFAQIRFEPGHFIDNLGQRKEVFIKNIGWKNSPTSFEIKENEGADIQQRTIENTAEFGVGGVTYNRFSLNIDRSSTVVDQLSDSPAIDWNTETLFVKLLVNGKLRLYQYEDSNLVKYFYSDMDHGKVTQLMYREYKVDGMILKNTNFRQQLYNLMKDKYTDAQKFKNIKYTGDALTRLFEDYNGAIAEKSKNADAGKSAFHLKVAAGTTFSKLEVATESGYSADFSSKTGFRAGLQAEYIFPFNRNKWSLFADPNYQTFEGETTSGGNTWKSDYQRLELPFGVRHYFYISDKSRVFVNAAYTLTLALGDSKIERNAIEELPIEKSGAWALGAGFAYDKFSLETRYVFGHSVTGTSYWLTDFSSLNLILAYQLF